MRAHPVLLSCLLSALAFSMRAEEKPDPIFVAAFKGDAEKLKQIIKERPEAVALADRDGETPLHAAAALPRLEIVQLLLDAKADPNAQSKSGNTPLYYATMSRKKEIVALLLKYKADPNAGKSPLLVQALMADQAEITALLLEHKADPNPQINGHPIILLLAGNGKTELVALLLKFKANIETMDEEGLTPLNVAAMRGQLGVVKLLLENNANPNSKDKKGGTPLQGAAFRGNLELVRLLLDHKADPNAKADDGATALDLTNNPDIQALLKAAGAKE